MKIKTVNYSSGGVALEVVAETEVEHMLLQQIWTQGGMSRGNGRTITSDGMSTGYFLDYDKKDKANVK